MRRSAEKSTSSGLSTVFDEQPDLIPQIASDNDVFEQFYQAYYPKILRMFQARVPDRSRSEELASDMILKLRKRIATHYTEQGKFSHWILRCVRYQTLNALRGSLLESHRFLDLDVSDREFGWLRDDSSDPAVVFDEQASAEEDALIYRRLSAIIQKQSPLTVRIMQLFYEDGFSEKQIAESLNLTLGAVKSRKMRTMTILRDAAQGMMLSEYVDPVVSDPAPGRSSRTRIPTR